MRCEVLAVGTELLLGQIVDTNSAWIGEQLAVSGIDSYEHRVVGDNQARIVAALRDLLSRCRRGHRLRWPRADAGRPDARRDRGADGRAARPPHGTRRADRDDVPRAAARHAREQPAAGRHPRRRRRDPEPARHRARAGVPGRRRQGRLRGAGRAVRDAGDDHRAGAPRPARAQRRGVDDRVALAEDVGHLGVRARGDGGAPARRARRDRQPDDRVPCTRHRGPRRAHHRQGRLPRPPRARWSTRRRRNCARSSASSCSASTTRRWSPPCSNGCAAAAGRSVSPRA